MRRGALLTVELASAGMAAFRTAEWSLNVVLTSLAERPCLNTGEIQTNWHSEFCIRSSPSEYATCYATREFPRIRGTYPSHKDPKIGTSPICGSSEMGKAQYPELPKVPN